MRSTKENRGVPVGRSPRPGQGPAGALRAHGTMGAVRKLPFSCQLPRAALQPLRLEPVIFAPASVSFLPFLGGDFSQGALPQCRFMQRFTAGDQSMLGYVFKYRVISWERTASGKGERHLQSGLAATRCWDPLVGRLEDKTETYRKGKMISFNING